MRNLAAWLFVAALVATAGCSGISVGGDAVELDAGATVVEEAAVSEAGYELEESGTEELNETVEAAGRERRVVVRNHLAVYQKTGGPDGTAAATVGVVTMPDASVAGRHLNPLVRMDETELLERFAGEEGTAMAFEERGDYTVRTLGGDATVTVYLARADDRPDAYVHLLRDSPAGSDDAVLAYAMYPAVADETEREDVETMLSSLRYTPPGDGDA